MNTDANEFVKPQRCSSCHALVWESKKGQCPYCKSEDLAEGEIPSEEASDFSRVAHNHNIEGTERFDNAMSFIVIGGISLIIGILFVFLSLKKRFNNIVGINPASFQFVVAMLGLTAGVILLTWGAIALSRAIKQKKQSEYDIKYLANIKRK